MAKKFVTMFASRRARALLASGVVLGLGTTATLAAYTDSEWATGSFSANATVQDKLELEGSPDGTTWSESVTMKTTLDGTKMVAGQIYYSPLYLRTTDTTNVPANVKVATPTVTGSITLASNISVNIVKPTNSMCSSDSTGAPIGGGQSLGTAATSSDDLIIITPGDDGSPSATTMICFQFTLTSRPNDQIAHNVTATWPVMASQR